MSKKSAGQRIDDARRAAHNDLHQVSSRLHGSSRERVQLGLLYKDMQGALHWAVECWLEEPARLGWHDQEARFLRIAPGELRKRYLHVAGRITQLMTDLHDRIGDDDVEQVVITAPSLADWRERAVRWHSEAEELVGDLTGAARKIKRIESGALRGTPNVLTPCFLLARGGGRHERWRHAGVRAGIFQFNERGFYQGVILPISLCSNAQLRQTLMDFAQLVESPMTHSPTSGRPTGASQRRAELQAWLNQRELGSLQLLDKEPTCSWVRFELLSEAFRDVLSHCEYVTAVSDKEGASTRVLEHAPFKFESHSELLEWADLDTRSHLPMPRFALFLANDLSRGPKDMFSGTWERKMMFRPYGYAMRFTVPDTTVSSTGVGIHFEDDGSGWVILRITLGEQDITIFFSDVYDPFPSLLEWLQAILVNDLPIGFEIDEEGTETLLIAHAFDVDRLLFAVVDKWDRTEYGAAVVDRGAFLAVFHKDLNDFLRDPSRFDKEGWSPTDLDGIESYWTDLLGHVFLSIPPDTDWDVLV